jgi:hypothetical protein
LRFRPQNPPPEAVIVTFMRAVSIRIVYRRCAESRGCWPARITTLADTVSSVVSLELSATARLLWSVPAFVRSGNGPSALRVEAGALRRTVILVVGHGGSGGSGGPIRKLVPLMVTVTGPSIRESSTIVTGKVALDCPAGIVTVAGTDASAMHCSQGDCNIAAEQC